MYIKCISLKEYTEAIISLSKSESDQVVINGIVTDLIMKGTLTLTPSFNVNSLKTINYLKSLDFEWPDLTHGYLGKIIENMKQVGFLHENPKSANSKFE